MNPRSVSSKNPTRDVVQSGPQENAVPYTGKGLMADLTFQGAKITRLKG